MLDMKFVRDNLDIVRTMLKNRNNSMSLDGFAELERKTGAMRTKEGIRGKVALGQYPYHAPFGYKNLTIKGEKYKKMVIDEDNAGEFIYFIKNNRRAIYSTKKKEFITNFDYSFFGYLSENRFLAHKNGNVGFIDTNGEEVISFIYDSPIPFGDNEFLEGRVVVYKDGEAGMIDLEGNIIIPFEYREVYNCREGMIWATDKNKNDGFLNRNGETVIPFGKYHIHSDFNNGFANVWDENHGNCYIDKNGNILEIKI